MFSVALLYNVHGASFSSIYQQKLELFDRFQVDFTIFYNLRFFTIYRLSDLISICSYLVASFEI